METLNNVAFLRIFWPWTLRDVAFLFKNKNAITQSSLLVILGHVLGILLFGAF